MTDHVRLDIQIISRYKNEVVIEFEDGLFITDEEMIKFVSHGKAKLGTVKFIKNENNLAFFKVIYYD